MVRFELLEPEDLSQALAMLAERGKEARVIAGGQGLLPMLKHRLIRPSHLINIKDLPGLDYISNGKDGLRIGALATHRTVETSPLIRQRYPVLAEMEDRLGCVQTRNWGTLVGNLCQASPTGDPAPVLIALGARVKAASVRGKREIALDEFFAGYLKTALEPDEIVLEIELPEPPPVSGAAYHKESVRSTDSPIASVAAAMVMDERLKTVRDAHIVLQAVGPVPIRAREAEKVIKGEEVRDNLLEEMAVAAAREACPISDIYGSAEYKREMVKVIARRVVSQAVERAKAGSMPEGV